ncbi:cupin domain-containing protein [Spirochaeta cellobiosiphila]|uniref:cupin domain-containing protein n=1 Tax=Spirochaeta cellobiosiphila TaxID=504483 RepID=UPI00040D1B04|nr:cupin domain-containing protein [Spirochaeta cellobiosiphila]
MEAKDFFIGPHEMKIEIVEGNVERRIYTGKNLQVVEYRFPPNKTFPPHSHDIQEQMGYCVSGRLGFNIGGIEKELHPGEWYHAPIGVEHNAWTFDEPAVLLDIFSPPRDDLR